MKTARRRSGPITLTVKKVHKLIPIIRGTGLANLRLAHLLMRAVERAKKAGATQIIVDSRKLAIEVTARAARPRPRA